MSYTLQSNQPARQSTPSQTYSTPTSFLQHKMQLFVTVFLAVLQMTSALLIPMRPVRMRAGVRMQRPPLLRPIRFVPIVGRVFRRPRPTISHTSHIHVPLNGRQFEHSHAFSDIAHSHDFGFPAGIYPEHGIGWDIPDQFRDSNTWAVFDKVNPDSVLVQNDESSPFPSDDTPDVMTDGAMFPDSIIPSDVEVPPITSEFLPTSDKRGEPDVTRPLIPVTTGNRDSLIPRNTLNNTVYNVTDGNKAAPENPGSVPSKSPATTARTIIIVEKTIKEPSCHKTGCLTGHECVFSNSYICPIYIPEVDCKCKAGCRVDYTFIPYGATVTMDTCGNTCSCFNMYGAATCSKKSCTGTTQKSLSTASTPEAVTPATKLSPLPTQTSLDVTTTDRLEINQPRDSVQMNFPVIPIVKSTGSKS